MRTSYSNTITTTTIRKRGNMLPFREITIADREEVLRYTAQMPTYLCEHCFVDLFIWKDHYHTQICFQDGFLLIKCESFPERTPMYLAPIGAGDPSGVLQKLRADAQARKVPFLLSSITPEQKAQYEELLGDAYVLESSEDAMDYIYLREKLETLAGKKLQSKRNLVNRFLKTYEGRWEYVPITQENKEIAYQCHLDWCERNGDCRRDASYSGETCAIKLALAHFEALHLKGGILFLDGKGIAFTLGCRAKDDLFVVQIEKADAEIAGAYQMINQQFVKANCQDVLYINREEDLGLEGLRKVKQSYHPEFMGIRYTAIPREEGMHT